MRDKNHIIALLALVIAVLTLVATFTVPEIRVFFGFEKETVPPQLEGTHPTVQSPESNLEIEQEPSEVTERPEEPVHRGSSQYTIHENQSQFVESAQTNLSVVFHDVLGEKVASLTIAPDGNNSSTHAVLAGYTQEFTSSVGGFLCRSTMLITKAKILKFR